MWQCSYCGKELNRKTKYTESGHLARCKEWKKWKDNNITKEILEDLYIKKKMSAVEIAERLNILYPTVIYSQLKRFGIETRTLSQSAKSERTQSRRAKTMLERYGVEHNLQSDSPVRKDMVEGLKEKYGVENVFQLDSVKKKIKKTIKKKYNVDHVWELSLIGKNYTKPHKFLVDFLEEKGYIIETEYKVVCEENIYFSDIFIRPNLLIELYGDYWHGNPSIYKKTDIILKGSSGEITVGEKWKRDKKRISNVKDKGYVVLIIWESDLQDSLQEIEEFINGYAKDCIN